MSPCSTEFLSSNEAQDGMNASIRIHLCLINVPLVVNSVWNGDLITRRKNHNHMDCKQPWAIHRLKLTLSGLRCIIWWWSGHSQEELHRSISDERSSVPEPVPHHDMVNFTWRILSSWWFSTRDCSLMMLIDQQFENRSTEWTLIMSVINPVFWRS